MMKLAVSTFFMTLTIGALAPQLIFSDDFGAGGPNAWMQAVAWSSEASEGDARGPEAIWLIDDFEDGILFDEWIDDGGTCNSFITNSPTPPEGIRSLDIFGSCGSHRQGLSFDLQGFQAGSISFYVRSDRTDSRTTYLELDDDVLGNNGGVAFFYGTDFGTFTVVDHTGLAYSCGPRNANQWYQIRINIDWDFHELSVYVDNELKASGVPFPVNITTLNWLYLYSLGNGHSLYDFIVASSAPPTVMIFSDGFESGDMSAWSSSVP